jgi:hypothetical protein
VECWRPLERTFLYAEESGGVLVLDLDPSPSPARTVWRVDPLGHDPFQPELAGVSKDSRAVRFNVFAQSNTGLRFFSAGQSSPKSGNPEQQEKGNKMRKLIYGMCVLVAAATIFVWSQNALVSSRANIASASVPPQGTTLAGEAATKPAMSSTEKMINYNSPLPVEQWDAF